MTLPLSYNWRNLLARKLNSALTFFVVAVVVFVLACLLSFTSGIRASLAVSGSDRNLIVIKPGATAESTSLLWPDDVARLMPTPGVAVLDAQGDLALSRELCVQVTLPRRARDAVPANVAVRGVDDVARFVHDEVRILSGRWLRQGAPEVLVGKAAQQRFDGLAEGQTVQLGRTAQHAFTVVGVFEAAGGALESELWAPRTMLADAFDRRFVSSVVLRMAPDADPQGALRFLARPDVDLQARREREYYAEVSEKTAEIVVLTSVLVGIMAIGAAFAVANTMFAAVDGRQREIAMLRTLGFPRSAILTAIIVEAVMICTLAWACGLAAATLLHGRQQDYMSDSTFTVLAYNLRLTPTSGLVALLLSTGVGVAGSLAPAVRAVRRGIVAGLRRE
jgi:putative ABC transport system permease protein